MKRDKRRIRNYINAKRIVWGTHCPADDFNDNDVDDDDGCNREKEWTFFFSYTYSLFNILLFLITFGSFEIVKRKFHIFFSVLRAIFVIDVFPNAIRCPWEIKRFSLCCCECPENVITDCLSQVGVHPPTILRIEDLKKWEK